MIPAGRYQKPWVVEQHLDLPAMQSTWLFARAFATQDEADDYAERMRRVSSSRETWRVRNREAEAGARNA